MEAEPRQLVAVRERIAGMFPDEAASHAWRVKLVACELLTLSIEQGATTHDVVVRVIPTAEHTRVEIVDPLAAAPAFDSLHGRLIVRLAVAWGVLREPPGYRTLWCDVARAVTES